MTTLPDRLERLTRAKDRRRSKALPPEYDFSAASIGISVVCVVITVMFAV